jgi:hypothetical protein
VHQLTTPERQFDALLAAEPSRPFVTYYDEASGERSELSAKSLANWVAKTHHLLVDELGLGVGDVAAVALPAHWISVPVLLGCLTAGLALSPDGAADVAFVTPATAQQVDAPDVYAIAPESAAVGFREAGPADPCLPGLTRGQVASRPSDLPAGARLLTTRPWQGSDDWLGALFAPLAVQGSLVIVANASEEVLERRADQERVTSRL